MRNLEANFKLHPRTQQHFLWDARSVNFGPMMTLAQWTLPANCPQKRQRFQGKCKIQFPFNQTLSFPLRFRCVSYLCSLLGVNSTRTIRRQVDSWTVSQKGKPTWFSESFHFYRLKIAERKQTVLNETMLNWNMYSQYLSKNILIFHTLCGSKQTKALADKQRTLGDNTCDQQSLFPTKLLP